MKTFEIRERLHGLPSQNSIESGASTDKDAATMPGLLMLDPKLNVPFKQLLSIETLEQCIR